MKNTYIRPYEVQHSTKSKNKNKTHLDRVGNRGPSPCGRPIDPDVQQLSRRILFLGQKRSARKDCFSIQVQVQTVRIAPNSCSEGLSWRRRSTIRTIQRLMF